MTRASFAWGWEEAPDWARRVIESCFGQSRRTFPEVRQYHWPMVSLGVSLNWQGDVWWLIGFCPIKFCKAVCVIECRAFIGCSVWLKSHPSNHRRFQGSLCCCLCLLGCESLNNVCYMFAEQVTASFFPALIPLLLQFAGDWYFNTSSPDL